MICIYMAHKNGDIAFASSKKPNETTVDLTTDQQQEVCEQQLELKEIHIPKNNE